ncbi:MAG: thioredoxin-like domain-containing protein [Bacteroidota bacterium]
MKKLFFVLFVFLLAGCATGDGYTLKFSLKDGAGKKVFLQKAVNRELVTIDSVQLDNAGKGVISGKVDAIEILYLKVNVDTIRPEQIYLDNAAYKVSGRLDSLEFKGNGLVTEFVNYNNTIRQFTDKANELSEKYKMAYMSGDAEMVNRIFASYDSLEMKMKESDSIYIASHPTSHVSVYLLRKSFYELDAEQLEKALSAFDESVHNSSYFQYMDEKLKAMKRVAIGEPYVDFSLPTPEGTPLELSSLIGENVLMIDFWASWCQPCRIANPEVVALYNVYKDKGFDILGVSLDRSRDAWLKAIADDGLVWHHVSDLKYWECEGAALYAVTAIPHTVIIDRKGVIRAKNLHGPALEAMIQQLINE